MSEPVEQKGLDTLQYAVYNPRDISEHDFKSLKKSMAEFGDLSGVVKNITTGNLVGGHQRVKAFNQASNPKIVITQQFEKANAVGTIARGYIEVGGLDEQFAYREVEWELSREQAANIAANRIQGVFNIDALAQLTAQLDPDLRALTGQTQKEIDKLLDLVGLAEKDEDEDDAPAVDEAEPPKSKPGEVYMLGRHFLMCGDATKSEDVEKLMAGTQADMIWTDPPYNVEYVGKTADALTIQNDSMSDSQFYQFLFDAFTNMSNVTKPGAGIYICHADSEGLNFRKAMIESGFLFKQCIIWNKNTMVLGRQDYQWKHEPILYGWKYVDGHEPILYGWKEGAGHYFTDDRNHTTVWDVPKPTRSDEHPTMKPLALILLALTNSSKRNAVVMDLFGGSGSTLMACDKSDRKCYTMELDPKYCDVIRKRFARAFEVTDDWEAFTPVLGAEAGAEA